MSHLKRNIFYFSLPIIIIALACLYYTIVLCNDESIKNIMIDAENFFAQNNYTEAEKLYQQAYCIKNTRFIKTRLSMLQHLNKIYDIVQKGNENDIQEIFISGEKEQWSQENILIFKAHCENFIHEFNRIRDDEQQINTLLQYAKNNNEQETNKLFKKIIMRFKQYGRSLEPLTQKILENISQGASVALKLLWKYNDILQIHYEKIIEALGTTNQMRLKTVQKLIQEDHSSINIMKELLDKQDRLELAKQYTKNKDNIEQNVNNAIQLCPDYADAYQEYASFLQEQKKYEKAIQYYEQAKTVYSQHIKLEQLWCHWFQNNLPEAVQGWEELAENNNQEALFGLSIFFILRGNIAKAKNLIERLEKNSIEKKLMHSIIHANEDTFHTLTIAFENDILLEYKTLCLACSYYYQDNLEKSQKYFEKYSSNPISNAYLNCIEYKKSLMSENNEPTQQETENNTPMQHFFNLIFSELKKTQDKDIQLLPIEWQELWNKTKISNIDPTSSIESPSNS